MHRSYATLLLGAGDPIGRRVRYRNYNGQPGPWNTIVGVVDDFEQPGTPAVGMIYHLVMPGEESDARMTVRLRGVTPEAFIPRMRSVANSINPMLQLSSTASLAATYAEYAKSGGQLALVILLVIGSVILLAAAGIHAMMAFTVSQRRREIGIRSALGAPGRKIVGALLGRASRQLAVGVAAGLFVALVGDRLSGGELMDGAGMVVVPATAAFMLVVGFFAAAGPVRRGLRVLPTEALRAE